LREKRPRISNNRSIPDRPEQTVSERSTKEKTDVNEDTSLVKGKLPDIEIDELWQKDTYELSGMSNYQIESDLKQSDESKDQQIDSSYNNEFLKDIYNTVDYDNSI